MNRTTLHHHHFGVLAHMAAEVTGPNQWVGWRGVRYGAFVTHDGQFVALPLSEVTVGGQS